MKNVLVTGASSGIGHACALELANRGFRVFAGVRKTSDAERLEREGGGRIVAVTIDVTDEASVRAAADFVSSRLDGAGLDGLVNNAGIGRVTAIEHAPMEVFREVFEVDFFGQISVIQAFLPLVRRARGRIVDIGTVGSHLAMPFGSPLGASKAAFRSLSDVLRMELRPFGIHVSVVEPGAIRTPAVEKTLGDVEGTIRALGPLGAERYGAAIREMMRRGRDLEMHGSPPSVVARAVHRALTARRPRRTYLAGRASRLLTATRLLPWAVIDRIMAGLVLAPARDV